MITRLIRLVHLALISLLLAATVAVSAQTTPTKWPTQDGTYIIKSFRFGTGESLPELKLHYLTLGKPHRDAAGHTDNVVLLLHGTGGNAHSLLNPVFSDVLFGPGQPLDITKYYIVLPDDIGHGQSSKPSDGLPMHFPQYDYDDMVASQHTMLVEGLHVDHLRLILGTSMGCMQSFVWGETFPSSLTPSPPSPASPSNSPAATACGATWPYRTSRAIPHGRTATTPPRPPKASAALAIYW